MQNKTVIYFVTNTMSNSIYSKLSEDEKYHIYLISVNSLSEDIQKRFMANVVIYNMSSCQDVDAIKKLNADSVVTIWFPEKMVLEKHEWCESYTKKVEFVPGTAADLDILLCRLSSFTIKKK